MSADVPIRPAATVIVMRDAPGGPEVFMVRRHHAVAFMAGAHVFPGGRVDEADRDAAAEWCDHGGRPEAALAPPPASFVAAARELFEEAGVLLARDRHGAFVSFARAADHARFEAYRDDVHQGRRSLRSIVEGEGLRLALDALVPYALWVTPPNEVRRFDTWFFLARVPPEQHAAHEHAESTDSTWIAPADALARAARGEMLLPPPTWFTLMELERFTSVGAALEWSARRVIHRRQPEVLEGSSGDRIIVLPPAPAESGDDPAASGVRFVWRGDRWHSEPSQL
jgi:8-oxo-dGTP pyrophosphatase MutT (NUDIX family)